MDFSGNPSCGSFDDGQGVRYEETYKMKIIEYDTQVLSGVGASTYITPSFICSGWRYSLDS